MNAALDELARLGFARLPRVFDEAAVEAIAFSLAAGSGERAQGPRGLLERSSAIARLATSAPFGSVVESVLGSGYFPVRAILFEKSAERNWGVPWHQDRTIAVRERVETAGFSAWTRKDGVDHVQPPLGILEGMLTLRLHLDDAGDGEGALRVVPGSHRFGLLPSERVPAVASNGEAVVASCARGDIFVMRPLLVHSSRRTRNHALRRILHIEYAATALPVPLAWRRY